MSGQITWRMTVQDLVQGTGGEAVSVSADVFTGVGTDTRADLSGQVFVALRGENFDAHNFVGTAVEKGAAALVVDRSTPDIEALRGRVTIIRVAETLKALQNLGAYWRRKMPARILGVTGTNGKTTTKEFTAAVIGAHRRTQFSQGSFNNHWGVPLSLLSISPAHEVAVIEMGMNHPGELTELSRIAQPDVVLCTMVGRGHLEGLGSIEGVAQAKEEIYLHAPPGAVGIFNLDNSHTRSMYERASASRRFSKLLTFGGQDTCDVSLSLVAAGPDDVQVRGWIGGIEGEARIPVFGAHNVTNLMAAASFALAIGLEPKEIWSSLPLCRNGWGRNQWVKLESGARVLFDAYNANPESMRAAIENFARLQAAGHKIGVFGQMREMGEASPEVHRELGESVGRAGFDLVCFVGPDQAAFRAGLESVGFSKKLLISNCYEQELASEIASVLKPQDVLLMKGSRGMQLERFLTAWNPVDFSKK